MPLIMIWNTLAAPRVDQFGRWLSDLDLAARLIKSWLGKRLSDGKMIERETSAFPVFRFYNLALTARITPLQFGAVVTESERGLAGSMTAVLNAWRLTDEWANRVREARLIGELMDVLVQITAGALGSIRRFATPSAEMFNPASARAVNLVGLGALAFRSIGAGREGLWEAAQRLERALRAPPPPQRTAAATVAGAAAGAAAAAAGAGPASAVAGAVAAAATSAETEETGPPLPLAVRLDAGLRTIAGAILIVPALGALLISMGRDLILWARHTLTDELFAIEQSVFDLRQSMLTGFRNGLHAFSMTAAQFLVLARDYALGHLRHWARFGVAYLEGVAEGVTAFTAQFETFWNGVNDLIQNLIEYSQRLMAIDLGEVIHNVLVLIEDAIDYIDFNFYPVLESPAGYDAPAQFPVTIGDLVLNEGGGIEAREQLALAATRLRAALAGASGIGLYTGAGQSATGINFNSLIRGISVLLPRLNQAPLDLRAQPVLSFSQAAEPDLTALVLRPLQEGVTRSVIQIGHAAQRGAEGIMVGLLDMLDGTALRFRGAAVDAVRISSLGHYRQFIAGGEDLVQQMFPDERPSPPTGLEPTGRVFATWLQGSFNAVGAVIGGYIGFLLEEWEQHLEANADTPVQVTETSPRILLERARLGRVHMEEMRIVAGRQDTGSDLAARVAAGFRGAVRNAYAEGRNRLGHFTAVATAREAPEAAAP